MYSILSSQADRAPPFIGSQLEAIKRRANEQQNADLRDEVGEDDGEVESVEDDDEESDARDEDSKSEGGDESGEDEGQLRLSMASQAAAQQPFNLQRRSTGQYFAQELPILESKES